MRLDSALKKSRPQYISAKKFQHFLNALDEITRIIPRPLSAVATVNEAIDSEWNITTGLFGLWMRVKLSDNFQMHEHSWPCRFHIIGPMLMDHGMPYPKKNVYC